MLSSRQTAKLYSQERWDPTATSQFQEHRVEPAQELTEV